MSRYSFEFFPPKSDEQRATLDATLAALKPLNPEYVSCTFGAGGSTLDHTLDTVLKLKQSHGLDAAPHLSCMGGEEASIRRLLETYAHAGIRRIVALRGDIPSGVAQFGGRFRYANELVAYIRSEFGERFAIEVAAYPEFHPQALNAREDLNHFKRKVDAGATGAITQYFFNADAYFRFIDDVRGAGISIPVVPGVMPISNFSQLKRFSDLCGAEIPRWLERRMSAFGDDAESIKALGADVVAQLCQRLLDGGAPSLHFYTLNRAKATLKVIERLR
jgi:methylenetetrahydrofolate reductase (NADPH)